MFYYRTITLYEDVCFTTITSTNCEAGISTYTLEYYSYDERNHENKDSCWYNPRKLSIVNNHRTNKIKPFIRNSLPRKIRHD